MTGANTTRFAAAIPSLRQTLTETEPSIDFPEAVHKLCAQFRISGTAWISFVRGFRGEAIGPGESSSLPVLLSPFRCRWERVGRSSSGALIRETLAWSASRAVRAGTTTGQQQILNAALIWISAPAKKTLAELFGILAVVV